TALARRVASGAAHRGVDMSDARIDAHTGLEVLLRDECYAHLAREHLGRLAVCVGGRPIVLPVNYALDGTDVVFRSAPGTKVAAATGRDVAFEIDGVDAFRHGGWSVLVVGTARRIDDDNECARLARLPVTPYGPGAKPIWVRIHPAAVTGRRIPTP